MDREIGPEVRRRKLVRNIVTVLLVIAAVGVAMSVIAGRLRPSLRKSELRTAVVERGTIEESLPASGTVVPLVEQVVASPVESRVMRIVLRAGDRVRKGDVLLRLDTAASELEAARLASVVSQKQSELTQLELSLDDSLALLRAQFEQKQLDREIVTYSAQQKTKLKEAGLVAEQEQLAAAAAARKNAIELRQLEAALARAARSRESRLAAARADLAIAQRQSDEARRQLELAMLRADRDGLVTWIAEEEGVAVRRGEMVARIADLGGFRVDATISDVYASRLAPGMRVKLKVDEEAIPARIDSVDPRIEKGTARFRVTPDTPGHPKLRNNMRVDVFVATTSKAGALKVRRGSLARNARYLFVVRDGEAVRTPARFGISSDDEIEVLDGASAGDEVLINDMTDYEGTRSVRLK